MKNLSSLLSRTLLTVTAALALGACNRSEYAMLPRSASYLGTTPVASTPRPAAPVAVASQSEAKTAPALAKTAPALTPAPEKAVVAAPAAAVPARSTAKAPQAVAVEATPEAATAVAPAAPVKLSLVQRLALKKISKKLDKLTANAPQLKQRDASASTTRLDSNLRTGLLFLLVGLILSLFGGISAVFAIIGLILAIIGLVFFLLWLLVCFPASGSCC